MTYVGLPIARHRHGARPEPVSTAPQQLSVRSSLVAGGHPRPMRTPSPPGAGLDVAGVEPTRSWSSAGPVALSQLRPLTGRGCELAGDPFARRARAHLDPRLPPSREGDGRRSRGGAGLPHIGSWEWGGALLALDGFPMTAVAEQIEPPSCSSGSSKAQQDGLQIVALGPESGGAVLRTLREGGLVGLLCDRDLVGNGVEVDSSRDHDDASRARDRRPAHGGGPHGAVVYSGPVRTTRA